jgi:F-type H+-transporting ATPase subunit b
MELNWTTFSLEIINFLALLWILKRFLYQPVRATLAQRRAGIERVLAQASTAQADASALRTQYESRLTDWEQEKAVARAHFEAELAREREKQMAALGRDLATERERSSAQEAHRRETWQRQLAAQAATQARQFASALLGKLAGADLEAQMLEVFVDELKALPEERLEPLRAGLTARGGEHGPGLVCSAYPLGEAQRQKLSAAIDVRLGRHCSLDFVEDGKLLAGVRLSLGAWQIDFSLAGELSVFAEASDLA